MKWFCKHDWDKWYDLKWVKVNGWPTVIQARKCKKCGKVKMGTTTV